MRSWVDLQRPGEEAGHPQLAALFCIPSPHRSGSIPSGPWGSLLMKATSFTRTQILQHMLPSFPPQRSKGNIEKTVRQMGGLTLLVHASQWRGERVHEERRVGQMFRSNTMTFQISLWWVVSENWMVFHKHFPSGWQTLYPQYTTVVCLSISLSVCLCLITDWRRGGRHECCRRYPCLLNLIHCSRADHLASHSFPSSLCLSIIATAEWNISCHWYTQTDSQQSQVWTQWKGMYLWIFLSSWY